MVELRYWLTTTNINSTQTNLGAPFLDSETWDSQVWNNRRVPHLRHSFIVSKVGGITTYPNTSEFRPSPEDSNRGSGKSSQRLT